ncbi:MAG: YqjD family protein [Bradymonadaceae bacterium]
MGDTDATDLARTGGRDLVRRGAGDGTAERIRELKASIEQSRERISESLDRVRSELRSKTDWRQWVEDHPWESVGIAFGIGFYLGFR